MNPALEAMIWFIITYYVVRSTFVGIEVVYKIYLRDGVVNHTGVHIVICHLITLGLMSYFNPF